MVHRVGAVNSAQTRAELLLRPSLGDLRERANRLPCAGSAIYSSRVPSTVAEILIAAGAESAGVVPWGVQPALPDEPLGFATGIYVVSLTDDPHSVDGSWFVASISVAAVAKLLDVRPELTLDGRRPNREQLAARLAGFWLPDEVVIYVGLAGPRASRPRQGEVARRVEEYYKTPLGARTPHAGGWPLKTLVSLSDLYVHYAYCRDVEIAEDACIRHFADHVSDATRERLYDPVRVMPFANLEFPRGNSKNHGIRGARAPGRTRPAQPATRMRRRQAARSSPALSPPATSPTSAVVSHHPSQKVTSRDIEVGQVRIPVGPTKAVLPRVRTDISVVLRGSELGSCRWDPGHGADKERSGVIRVGRAAARALLQAGDVLAVSAGSGAISLD